MKRNFQKFLVKPTNSVKEVLKKLNKRRTLYVVDQSKKLLGSITDGDIRRFLIKNKSYNFNRNIKEIFNKKPFYRFEGFDPIKLKSILSDKIKDIPILDKDKKITQIFDGKKIIVPIYSPYLYGNEKKYINEAIDSGWISSTGKYVQKFENKFKKYLKCKYAITVNNGTSALQLALMTIGVKPGDEVIVPGLTFYAPMNAIISVGAKPVPVDVSLKNFCIDLNLIEKKISKKTKAIIIVHLYGFPLDIKRLKNLKKKYKLVVIEDCAEALGSFSKKKHVGLNSDIATFSFFGNKTITTGEGGMFVTKNRDFYQRAYLMKNHGMSKNRKYFHLMNGLNFRMTNLQAAIGLAQIEQIREILSKKKKINYIYKKMINQIEDVEFQPEYKGDVNSYWLFVIKLEGKLEKFRDELIKIYKKKNYDVRRTFFSLDEMPIKKFYSKHLSELKNSKKLSKSCLAFPSFPNLPVKEIPKIVGVLSDFVKSKK